MARKLNITQEMEDALRKMDIPQEKIAELKEMEVDADVERLDLDGLDGVSGGGGIYGVKKWAPDDWKNPIWNNWTWIEGANFIKAIYDSYGEDICIDMCNELFCKSYDWEYYIHGTDPVYAALYMWSICYSLA